jgi:hypothetical protein
LDLAFVFSDSSLVLLLSPVVHIISKTDTLVHLIG